MAVNIALAIAGKLMLGILVLALIGGACYICVQWRGVVASVPQEYTKRLWWKPAVVSVYAVCAVMLLITCALMWGVVSVPLAKFGG